jgi:hypothetical protein
VFGSCAGPSFSSIPPQTQSQRERIDTGTAGDERAESAPEMTMEGDRMLWCFVQHRFGPFQPPEERRRHGPRRSRGLQHDESRTIREASPLRLAELTPCEEEALRLVEEMKQREREARRLRRQTIRQTKEEESRREQTETIRQQEARRREELAEHTTVRGCRKRTGGSTSNTSAARAARESPA